MNNLIFPCLACLIIGAMGGFAGGFPVAAMVLTKKPVPVPALEHRELRVAAVDGEAKGEFV